MVSLFHRLPLGGKLCHVVAVMRGSYITIQDFQANRQQKWSAALRQREFREILSDNYINKKGFRRTLSYRNDVKTAFRK